MNTQLLCRVLLGATLVMLILVFVGDGGDAAPPTTSGTGRAAAPPRPTVVFARGDAPRDLYVATQQGTSYQIQRITNTPAGEVCPSWSPDGERIAFQSDRDDEKGDIYVMDRDGTDVVRLTSSPGFDWQPRWSPDGNHIVWVRSVAQKFNIWIMNADGSNQHQLTHLPQPDVMPDWAPDSQWIAWSSQRDGNREIYRMKIDGKGLTRLTNTAANELSPAWSPDGLRITYTRPVATGDPEDPWGPEHIWVMNADGTGQTQLTSGASHCQPRWSSLGTHIMFSSFPEGSYDIYTMKADGSDVRQVISGPTDNWYHDWLILR